MRKRRRKRKIKKEIGGKRSDGKKREEMAGALPKREGHGNGE